MTWAKAQAVDFDVTVTDIPDETYMLAFQRPKPPEILDRLAQVNLSEVVRFTAVSDTIFDDVHVKVLMD